MATIRPIIVLCILLLAKSASCEPPTKLRLATTDWCPYACKQNGASSGIVYEYVSEVLADVGVQPEITFYPWTRAIRESEKGSVDGLLTAVQEEAPHLLMSREPIMNFQMCFLSRDDKRWQYDGQESLEKINLGVISDYSYGEPLDSYLNSPRSDSKVYVVTGANAVERLFEMLKRGRVDAIADDSKVLQWQAKKLKLNIKKFHQSGCMESHPFYIGIDPRLPWAREILEIFDAKFSDPTNRELLDRIVEKYL